MNLLNTVTSITISNLLDVIEEIKINAVDKNKFISAVGAMELDNGYGSYIIKLRNPHIKGIWISEKGKSNRISAVMFSHPQISIDEFVGLCPEAVKKYNAHDEEFCYVCEKNGFLLTATLDESGGIMRLSVSW